ncbi:hypothetical protein [Pseudoalteromonas sp. T1lg23B]|uniref:hypothetical protein n=1 Tax=Pseudoalteromonas sp. T1lg23B TaxID=2077097 RepID=UPI000CF6D35C|nr:hypothetical protein [Pseudoalteromonas sp. T1lg23B]
MKDIKSIWFWFTLVVCPLLVLLGIFTLGKLLGQYMYSEQFGFSSIAITQIGFIGAGICAFSQLLITLKQAKKRFAK